MFSDDAFDRVSAEWSSSCTHKEWIRRITSTFSKPCLERDDCIATKRSCSFFPTLAKTPDHCAMPQFNILERKCQHLGYAQTSLDHEL